MRAAIAAILLYVVFALFILEDVLSIGVDPTELQRQYVFGVPTRDLALAIPLLAVVRWFASVRKSIHIMHLASGGALIAVYLALGIWNYGLSNQLNGDIRIGLWCFGGIGVACLLSRTSAPKWHVQVLLAAFTGCMVLASLFSEGYYATSLGFEQISHPEVYTFSRLAAGPIVLLCNLSGPSLVAKALPLTCLGAFVFFSAVLTGTRSQLIVSVAIGILLLRSFGLRINGNFAAVRPMAPVTRLAVLLVTFVGIAYLAASMDAGRLTRFATIGQPAVVLGDPRADESRSFFTSSTPAQLFFGRGLGGTVPSPIYGGQGTPVMHIGIMNVWLKLGWIPVATAVVWIYLLLPARYFKSVRMLRRRGARVQHRDVARVVIWPALLPWMLWFLLSGGFSEHESLFLGWIWYMSGSVSEFGLGPWLSRGRRRTPRASCHPTFAAASA